MATVVAVGNEIGADMRIRAEQLECMTVDELAWLLARLECELAVRESPELTIARLLVQVVSMAQQLADAAEQVEVDLPEST